jgi:hypothetical protein
MESFGKIFILVGTLFLLIGGALLLFKHIPFFGKLPGDFLIQKKNFTFYFPLTTSILLSLFLTLIWYMFKR